MKTTLLILFLIISSIGFGQIDKRISTIDFVQILNDNKAEALFYYQNNWEELRKTAIAKGYIHSYQLLEVPVTEEEPSFQFMLVTTYADQTQYDQREKHFQELIKAGGGLKLMNDKKSGDFRKTLFNKEEVRHWN